MLRRIVTLALAAVVALPSLGAQAIRSSVFVGPAKLLITGVSSRAGFGAFTNGAGFVSDGSAVAFAGDPLTFFCTDYDNNINLPASYTAFLTPLFGNTDMSRTRLGNRAPNPLTAAQALGLYTANVSLAAGITTASLDNSDQDRQGAMWRNALFSSNIDGPLSDDFQPGFSTQGWYVVTDVNSFDAQGRYIGGGRQELLVFRSSVVPEPSTYALMATGLGMVALVARRRRVA